MKSVTFLLDDDVYATIEVWGHDNDRSFSEALRHGLRIFFMPASEPEKVKRGRTAFVRPELEDIRSYVLEHSYGFDPEEFWAFYEAKGWKVGNQPMRSWRAACLTWQKRRNDSPRSFPANHKPAYTGISSPSGSEYGDAVTDEELESGESPFRRKP